MSSTATTPTASATLAPPPNTSKKLSAKSSKGKLANVLVLRLSPEQLRKFPSDLVVVDAATVSGASTPPSDNAKPALGVVPGTQASSPGDAKPSVADAGTPNPSEVNGDGALSAPAANGVKRKASTGEQGGASGKPSGVDTDEGKPKAKPGPKRRKLDADGKGMWTAPPHLSHRLGPKANQGDINARLRALDRSGKPSRKWQRKGLQLASFNGVKWGMASWKTTKLPEPTPDADAQSQTTGSSEPKREPPSSNVASEKSNAGGADGAAAGATTAAGDTTAAITAAAAAPTNGTPIPSSPAPLASASA